MKHLSTNMSAQFVLLCKMLKNSPKELVTFCSTYLLSTKDFLFKNFAKNLFFLKRAKYSPTYKSHVFTINDENGNEIGNKGYRGKFIFFKFIDKGSDHLAHSWGVLADFWVPNEIDSLNFQHMLLF